ncbi:unnamed protein product [Lampetra fluviatilis]
MNSEQPSSFLTSTGHWATSDEAAAAAGGMDARESRPHQRRGHEATPSLQRETTALGTPRPWLAPPAETLARSSRRDPGSLLPPRPWLAPPAETLARSSRLIAVDSGTRAAALLAIHLEDAAEDGLHMGPGISYEMGDERPSITVHTAGLPSASPPSMNDMRAAHSQHLFSTGYTSASQE